VSLAGWRSGREHRPQFLEVRQALLLRWYSHVSIHCTRLLLENRSQDCHSLALAQHAESSMPAQAVAALCCVQTARYVCCSIACAALVRSRKKAFAAQVLVGRGFGLSDAATFTGPLDVAALMSGPCEALRRSCRLVSPPEDTWDVHMCVD